VTEVYYPALHKYIGLSGDSKTTSGVQDGTGWLETDTGKEFSFQASSGRWIERALPRGIGAIETLRTRVRDSSLVFGPDGRGGVNAKAGGGSVSDPLVIGAVEASGYVAVGGVHLTPSGIQYVDVQLNNDQILNLKASPVELIPAPGGGLGIYPLWGYIVKNTQGGAYTSETTPNPTIGYTGNLQYNYFCNLNVADLKAGPLDFSVDYIDQRITVIQILENLPLIITRGTDDDELAGGHVNNTLSLRIWYSIVPTVPFGA
jgi:hypothetical protein